MTDGIPVAIEQKLACFSYDEHRCGRKAVAGARGNLEKAEQTTNISKASLPIKSTKSETQRVTFIVMSDTGKWAP
jgi:hypothetical protein